MIQRLCVSTEGPTKGDLGTTIVASELLVKRPSLVLFWLLKCWEKIEFLGNEIQKKCLLKDLLAARELFRFQERAPYFPGFDCLGKLRNEKL